MKWPCVIDAVILIAFIVACIWEWRRDVNAKARAELKELILPKATAAPKSQVVNPYRSSMKDFLVQAERNSVEASFENSLLVVGFTEDELGVYRHPDGRVWRVKQ